MCFSSFTASCDMYFHFHFVTAECRTYHLAVGLDSTPLCCPVEHNKQTVTNRACVGKLTTSKPGLRSHVFTST